MVAVLPQRLFRLAALLLLPCECQRESDIRRHVVEQTEFILVEKSRLL
jgi:hypothetical protein